MAPQDDLLACAVSAWYPQFRHVTFKTALLPLPPEFVQYLVADGVHVHGETEAVRAAQHHEVQQRRRGLHWPMNSVHAPPSSPAVHPAGGRPVRQ